MRAAGSSYIYTGTTITHPSTHLPLPVLACLIAPSIVDHELPGRLPAAGHRRVPSAGPAAGLRRTAAGVPAVPGRRRVRPAAAAPDHQPRRRRLLERMLRRHLLLLRPRHVLLMRTTGRRSVAMAGAC
ncbi:hypothetical protein SEVIR_6G027201v4 [Setaria viridis]